MKVKIIKPSTMLKEITGVKFGFDIETYPSKEGDKIATVQIYSPQQDTSI